MPLGGIGFAVHEMKVLQRLRIRRHCAKRNKCPSVQAAVLGRLDDFYKLLAVDLLNPAAKEGHGLGGGSIRSEQQFRRY